MAQSGSRNAAASKGESPAKRLGSRLLPETNSTEVKRPALCRFFFAWCLMVRINLHCYYLRCYSSQSDGRETSTSACFKDSAPTKPLCHMCSESLINAHHERRVICYIVVPKLLPDCIWIHLDHLHMPNTGHNWRRETDTELDLTRSNSATTRGRAVQFMPSLGISSVSHSPPSGEGFTVRAVEGAY